ncbi:DUF5776 domain-containing protein [Lentilactobacillus hilgardii]|nr:DUF5776 domain-containing protein [Lentilactobacillus hilgardii]MCV3739600.1 DUF5776 domain-containing protein [Lentilactobacillus hilgardii]
MFGKIKAKYKIGIAVFSVAIGILGIGSPQLVSASESSSIAQATASNSNKTVIDKSKLNQAIVDAQTYKSSIGNDAQISQDRYNRALSMATSLQGQSSATQDQIDSATTLLNSAISENSLFPKQENPNRYTAVPVGQKWLDTQGAPIQAHGGGFLKQIQANGQPIYYWVGEDKSQNNSRFNGITLYSSTDLMNWTYRKTILAPSLTNKGLENATIERPKILYNSKTKEYVVWAHWESAGGYSSSQICVATSKTIDGDYQFLGHWRPGANATNRNWRVTDQSATFDKTGQPISDYSDESTWGTGSRDFTLFQDGDKAYIVSTQDGSNMRIYELNADFTDVDKNAMKSYLVFPRARREAPALVKDGQYYFMINSSQSGWYPNQARYSYTKNLSDENGWKSSTTPSGAKVPAGLLGNNSTYYSQPTGIMAVNGTKQTSYIYMGDRWNPDKLGESTYVWLPLTIKDPSSDNPSMSMAYTPGWQLDNATGEITTGNDQLLSQGKPATTDAAGSVATGDFGLNQANNGDAMNLNTSGGNSTYFKPIGKDGQPQVPFTYTVDLQKSYNLSHADVSFNLYNGSESFSQYTIETSLDGRTWQKAADESANTMVGFVSDKLSGRARYVRLNVSKVLKVGKSPQNAAWTAGLVEFQVYGTPIETGGTTTPAPSTPPATETGASSSSSNIGASSSSVSSTSSSAASSSTDSGSTTVTTKKKRTKYPFKIYAKKSIYLYRHTDFTKKNQLIHYQKKSRINADTFTVVGTARSKSHALRYKVRDTNNKSRLFGKVGYVTASPSYVARLYYQTLPKSKTITVIAKKGVDVYRSTKQSNRINHYKRGTILKIKKIIKNNKVTNYQLRNGNYVTGNKKIVIQGKY